MPCFAADLFDGQPGVDWQPDLDRVFGKRRQHNSSDDSGDSIPATQFPRLYVEQVEEVSPAGLFKTDSIVVICRFCLPSSR